MLLRCPLVLLAVLGCHRDASGPREASAPHDAAPQPTPAVKLLDAGPRALVQQPTQLASQIGYSDVWGTPSLALEGESIYWYSAPADRNDVFAKGGMRRIGRDGGTSETIGGLAARGGVGYEASAKRSRPIRPDHPVDLYRVQAGTRTKLGTARGGSAGCCFRFDGDHVYWNAPWPIGVGPVFATHLASGRTTRILPCAPEPPGLNDTACPEILTGTPLLARRKGEVFRLERGKAIRIPSATCPTDPNANIPLRARHALGEHVLCAWHEMDPWPDAGPSPEPVIIALATGAVTPAHGLGDHATFAGSHWYHATAAGILRRPTLDGADELVVALPARTPPARIVALAADEHGLVWVENDTLWTAPLP